jgi:4-hydroxybenzoate polyprenyltransferase
MTKISIIIVSVLHFLALTLLFFVLAGLFAPGAWWAAPLFATLIAYGYYDKHQKEKKRR